MQAQGHLHPALAVFGPDGLMGTLYPTEPLSFSYSADWLGKVGATAIHAGIPLVAGRIDSPFVTALFENLLPEGDQRKLVTMREQVSTVFGLLWKIGGESAGSLVLLPEGGQPQPFAFSIGGETDPGNLDTGHLFALAKTIGVGQKYMQKLGHDMALAVEAAVPAAAAEVLPRLAPGQRVLAERLVHRVASMTRKMRHRVVGDALAPAKAPPGIQVSAAKG